MNEKHVGSDFDDFLREEGLLEDAEAVASKRVLAFLVSRAMEEQNLTKAAMARRMGTSRSSLDRLLDPSVPSVTLATIEKAARALGKEVQLDMVEADSPPPAPQAYGEHEVVVLRRDLPDLGLVSGDVGTVVGSYRSGGYEVEFAVPEGDTFAVVTLAEDEIRRREPHEILHVRQVARSAG